MRSPSTVRSCQLVQIARFSSKTLFTALKIEWESDANPAPGCLGLCIRDFGLNCAISCTDAKISTTDGELTPGKLIILEGSGFGDAVGTVFLGGTAVRVSTWGSTQMAIVLPPFDVSTTLRVCQAGGINCSNSLQLVRASAPPPARRSRSTTMESSYLAFKNITTQLCR